MRDRETIKLADRLTVRIPVAAEMLGVGRTKLYALIKSGDIEAIKIGGSTVIVVASIHALVERQRARDWCATRPVAETPDHDRR